MKKLAALTLSLFLSLGTAFADSPKDTPKDSTKDTPKESDAQPSKTTNAAKPTTPKTNEEIAAEMEELRQALQAQQEQLQMLKEELAKRDREIEAAREAAAAANSRATEATTKAAEAEVTSNEAKSTASSASSSVASLAANTVTVGNAPAAGDVAANATPGNAAPVNGNAALPAQGSPDQGPLTIRYKGVEFTPGGFIAAESVFRQRSTSSDIATPFTSIPFPGNPLSKLTEYNMTGRQSRMSLRVNANVGDTKLTGYVESDFLGVGTASNDRQSNSYVLRQRQVWGRAETSSGWAFTGGQMWSLVTENRKGLENLTEAVPTVVDPNYNVGFTWARQPGVRLVKNFSDKFAIGFSIEESQATVGGRGFSTYTNTSATGVVTTYQNFFVDAPGASAGLYNAFDTTGYSVDKLPDFIVKAALDPGWGHYELFGIVSDFRNRVYPCAVQGTTADNFPTPVTPVTLACGLTAKPAPSVAGAYNYSGTGGGVGGSITVPLFSKHLDAGIKAVYGDGIGRYGTAQLSDVTARPNGSLALIHDGQWLGRLELHATPKLDLYGYFGGEYAGRTAYKGYESVKITNTPAIPGCGAVGQQPCPGGGIQPNYPALTSTSISLTGIGGYGNIAANNSGCFEETLPSATGTPGSGGTCAGDIRYISEATLGFWHKIYQGEKGRVQWGIAYSYLWKTGWSGAGDLPAGSAGIAPKAIDNMVWTSFRYYLP